MPKRQSSLAKSAGEAGVIEAAVEVGDVLVGDGDGEGFGLRHGTAS